MLDPIYTWQPTTCGMCGQPIVYVGPYWQHTGEAQPRHPAIPVEEWERIKPPPSAELTRAELLALLRRCRPWLPAVERDLREAVARALGEEI